MKTDIKMELPPLENVPFVMRKKKDDLEYLHRQPTIKPNYGHKKQSHFPKTNVSRVLLYDNTTQDQIRDVKMKYFERERKRTWRIGEINKRNFLNLQEKRGAGHQVQMRRYEGMKNAFIAEHGSKYMPVTEKEAKEDPFLGFAKLAPPINVLCYFLEQRLLQKEEEESRKKQKVKEKTIADMDDMFRKFKTDPLLPHFAHSVEDPRFRELTESLESISGKHDGYLQLCPGYLEMIGKAIPKRRLSGMYKRVITLPNFYTRVQCNNDNGQRVTSSRDSTRSDKRASVRLSPIQGYSTRRLSIHSSALSEDVLPRRNKNSSRF